MAIMVSQMIILLELKHITPINKYNDHRLFYKNKYLQVSDLFNKGFEFKGIWVII